MKPREEPDFRQQVDSRAALKLRAQSHPIRSVWLGFGASGVIGWSIAAPTLLGTMAGIWLDRRYPGGHSWTLMLLVAGLCIGCFQAWNWISQQDKSMHEQPTMESKQESTND